MNFETAHFHRFGSACTNKKTIYKVCFKICVAHIDGVFWFDVVSEGGVAFALYFARAYMIQINLFCFLQMQTQDC